MTDNILKVLFLLGMVGLGMKAIRAILIALLINVILLFVSHTYMSDNIDYVRYEAGLLTMAVIAIMFIGITLTLIYDKLKEKQ